MKKYVILISLILLGWAVKGQELLKIPLSKPGQTGTLQVKILEGTIKVSTHEKAFVEVLATLGKLEKNSKNGVQQIDTRSLNFEVAEINNLITIEASNNFVIDFHVKVPKKFSVNLSTNRKGEINVIGVNGYMEISNKNGDVILSNISGAVIADAENGGIIATFEKVDPKANMAFSSLHGDIDLTFPQNIRAYFKIKTGTGKVFSAFELKPDQSSSVEKKTGEKNIFRIKGENSIEGKVNGGGPEIMITNYLGDIIIKNQS